MMVRHIIGVRLDIATAAKSRQLRASQILVLLVVGAVVIEVLNPVPGMETAPIGTKLAFWTIVLALFSLSYTLAEIFMVQVAHRWGWEWVPELPISAFAVSVTAVILLHLTRAMTIPHLSALEVFWIAFANFLWIQILGHAFVAYLSRWVMHKRAGARPAICASRAPATNAPDAPAIRVLHVNGQRLLEHEVVAMVGHGQYVEVHSARRYRLFRTSLKSLVSQTGPQSGLLINRGVWVSRAALSGLRRNKTSLWVEFDDGQRYFVSRSRRADVEAMAGTPVSSREAYTR